MTTAADVYRALSAIKDPDLGRDIVSLGFVQDLRIEGGEVSFRLVLTTPACPVRDRFLEQARALVGALPGVERVEVVMDAAVAPARPRGAMLPGVKNIILVASGKGGVGKSTVSVNLAVALAEMGASVGLLDADIYGPNVPQMLGLDELGVQGRNGKMQPHQAFGIKIMSIGFMLQKDAAVIWRGPLVSQAVQQMVRDADWGELDYMLVDLPPGTGDVQLTLAQAVPVTGAVVVSTPQSVALADATRGMAMFRRTKIPVLGIIENMSYYVCANCHERADIFSHGGAAQEAERAGVPFLGEIPLDPAIRIGGDEGVPVLKRHPGSAVSNAFRRVAEQLAARVSIESQTATARKIEIT